MLTRKMKCIFLFSLILVVAIGTSGVYGDIHEAIPGIGTIEAAVSAANDDDIIVLLPGDGTYPNGVYTGKWIGRCNVVPYEWHPAIEPKKKRLTFRSMDPNNPDIVASTIIYGYSAQCQRSDCFDYCYEHLLPWRLYLKPGGYFKGGKNCKVEGLTFVSGFRQGEPLDDPIYSYDPGGTEKAALQIIDANLTISKCRFIGGDYVCENQPPPEEEKFKEFDTGGIYCENSNNTVIKNCTFHIARIRSDDALCTAVVKITGNSNVTIKDCNISDNHPYSKMPLINAIELVGGNLTVDKCTISGNQGTGVKAIENAAGDVTITDCTIDGGNAYPGLQLGNSGNINITGPTTTIRNCYGYHGAGIFIDNVYDPVNITIIDDCTFTGNNATGIYDGGAIYIRRKCDPGIINKCTITENEANNGGGIYVFNEAAENNITISNCTINDNKASCNGGGIGNLAHGITVTHCIITGNKALNPNVSSDCGHGGGIYSEKTIDINNCMITGNHADGDAYYSGGGGICIPYWDDKSNIINSTIADNSVLQEYAGSGAYFNADVDLKNCIFWGNFLENSPETPHQQIQSYDVYTNIKGCDIQYSDSKKIGSANYIFDLNTDALIGIDGGGNVLPPYPQDPQFIGDYHLSGGSPCIDAGDDAAAYGIDFDIDGDARIIGPHVDIGADEANSVVRWLVSWWKFDEGSGTIAYDSAGDNDGTVYGATWTTGQIDGALSFDGSGDRVMVGDKDNLEQQEFTLSFWARLNNPSGSLQGGIAKGYIFGSATEFSYRVDFHGGYVRAGITTDPSNAYFGVTSLIGDSNWHMWTMTVGDNTVSFYKDGVLVGSTAYTGTIDYTKNNNNFVIGARDYGSYAFDGKIDDVRLYDRALSAGEIWQLYQKGLGPKAVNPNPADGAKGVDPNTVLSWSPGYLAISHDVYFGTDYSDVYYADIYSPEYKGNQTNTTYDPGTLSNDTTYYWRIDEKGSASTTKGDVWSFTTWVPNLVSLWKFDEGSGTIAYDSAGDNDGTVYGATWTTGQIDGALSFDGSGDRVMVGDKDNLEQQEFTLSFWARLNNPSGSLQGGIAKGYIFGASAEYSYKLDFHSGVARAYITNTLDTGFGITCQIGDNGWHMWSMTVDNNTISLYKDGTYINSTGYTGTIDYTKTHNNFVIGARDNGSYAFNGKIDEVRFYNRALSSGEIEQLY